MGSKMNVVRVLIICLSVMLFVFPEAYAKEKRKQTLQFEDELVEGETQKPELFYLLQKKNFNYKRLIRLRENFLPEMRKSAGDLQQ